MTYNKLNSILKNNSEIHYKSDCSQFFLDNNLNINDYSKYKFILFEYTTTDPGSVNHEPAYRRIIYIKQNQRVSASFVSTVTMF